jgi:hypothetical protein
MSEIKVNKISPATGTDITLGDSGDTLTVPSGGTIVNSGTATGFGGGSILQMKTVQYASHVTTTNNSMGTSAYDVTGLTMVMTPTLASSHILVTGQMAIGHHDSYCGRVFFTYNHSGISETVVKANGNSWGMTWRVETTEAGDTRTGGNIPVNLFLSPATANEITFKIRIMTSSSSTPIYMNGDGANTNNSNDGGNDISSLTFWEIANSITPTLSNTGIDT